MIEANWPLIIPPLLALTDDTSIVCKIRGCECLTTFLQVVPAVLLQRTGLGQVFESALTPCLLYLPSLTEESQSLQILAAAYPALISLAQVQFPDTKNRDLRMKALDRILRQSVLKGYTMAGDNVKIAEFLVNQITVVTDEMGIDFIRHLKVWKHFRPQV